jgi:hypothetical protein
MVCLSAMPASLLEMGKPSVPASRSVAESRRNVTDRSSPTLYRPPISLT